MATNKVVYGNNTLIDLTSDTATPSDVASGVTFHDRSGTAQTGSYVAPTITSITPSNSSPVTLTEGNNYAITGNGGKAVESITNVHQGDTMTMGGIYKMYDTSGSIVPGTVTVKTNQNTGKIYEGYYKFEPSLGYMQDFIGYFIGGQEPITVTPDDDNPPRLSGAFYYKVSGFSGGYLYKTQQSGGVTLNPSQLTAVCVRNTTSTVTVDTTKHYIVTATMRITGAAVRGGSWYVNEGVVTELTVTSDASANVTISGSTLTLQGTQASYNIEFHVIQLD